MSDYYEKVSDFHNALDKQIKALTEAQKIISPSLKNRETFPGLIPTTPKATQRMLLGNAWIVLRPIDESGVFSSDIEDLEGLLGEVGECPVKTEPEFQGYPVGR